MLSGIRFWIWLMMIFIFGRLGEAAHPGPDVSSEDSFLTLTLGTANSSGIAHKSSHYVALPMGVWGFSESQATAAQFQTFQREVAQHGKACGRRVRTLHGAYATPRPGSADCGSWTGVGFVSDFSCSPMAFPWHSFEFQSGRAFGARFVVNGWHLRGAVIYAPPSGPTHKNAADQALQLLQVISQELIFGAEGLRFILGDFNRDDQSLAIFDSWRWAGWKEVQALALERFGRIKTPTSKSSAFSDQIWVSPELASMISSVNILPETFSDHDPLYATCALPSSPTFQWHWHMPASLPWRELDESLDFEAPQISVDFSSHPTRAFAKWSHEVEAQCIQGFQQRGCKLPEAVHGRGQTLHTKKRPLQLAAPKHGRHGDEFPRSDFLNRAVHRWFKQLRRIQAYTQRAMSGKHGVSAVDQVMTWRNILYAPGFKGGFQLWWQTRHIKLHGSPGIFPNLPPDGHIASLVLLDFRANFKSFERWQMARRSQIISARAHDHNRLLFRQLRQKRLEPPDRFELQCECYIADVQPDGAVQFDEDPTIPLTASWKLQGEVATVTLLRPGFYSIDSDLLPVVGHRLIGRFQVHTFPDMEKALADLWLPIWTKHLQVEEGHWQRALNFIQGNLPTVDIPELQWTPTLVSGLSKRYKKITATGPDGWSRDDVANLPAGAHADLASMYNLIQTQATWPNQITTGFTCPVPKHEEAIEPGSHRPIIVLSFLYRLWAAGASKMVLPYLASLAGTHIYGYIPKRRASDIWFLTQSALELAYVDSSMITGFNLDLTKCFNHLPRSPLMAAMRKMGLPRGVERAWTLALSSLSRRFKISTNVGPPHQSSCGYPEGDPLSCLAMVAFTVMLDLYMSRFAGHCLVDSLCKEF